MKLVKWDIDSMVYEDMYKIVDPFGPDKYMQETINSLTGIGGESLFNVVQENVLEFLYGRLYLEAKEGFL